MLGRIAKGVGGFAKGVAGAALGEARSALTALRSEENELENLLNQLSEAMPDSRRKALSQLRDLVVDNSKAQASVGSLGLPILFHVLLEDRDDLELLRGALELILSVLSSATAGGQEGAAGVEDDFDDDDDDRSRSTGRQLSSLISRQPMYVTNLLSLLEDEPIGCGDLYVRMYVVQLLTRLLKFCPRTLQAVVRETPASVARLVSLLRCGGHEVLRNEALLLLTGLARGDAEAQKVAAFEGAFEAVLEVVGKEGGAEGGIVVQDALELLATLVSGNAPNQRLFCEMGFTGGLLELLKPFAADAADVWVRLNAQVNAGSSGGGLSKAAGLLTSLATSALGGGRRNTKGEAARDEGGSSGGDGLEGSTATEAGEGEESGSSPAASAEAPPLSQRSQNILAALRIVTLLVEPVPSADFPPGAEKGPAHPTRTGPPVHKANQIRLVGSGFLETLLELGLLTTAAAVAEADAAADPGRGEGGATGRDEQTSALEAIRIRTEASRAATRLVSDCSAAHARLSLVLVPNSRAPVPVLTQLLCTVLFLVSRRPGHLSLSSGRERDPLDPSADDTLLILTQQQGRDSPRTVTTTGASGPPASSPDLYLKLLREAVAAERRTAVQLLTSFFVGNSDGQVLVAGVLARGVANLPLPPKSPLTGDDVVYASDALPPSTNDQRSAANCQPRTVLSSAAPTRVLSNGNSSAITADGNDSVNGFEKGPLGSFCTALLAAVARPPAVVVGRTSSSPDASPPLLSSRGPSLAAVLDLGEAGFAGGSWEFPGGIAGRSAGEPRRTGSWGVWTRGLLGSSGGGSQAGEPGRAADDVTYETAVVCRRAAEVFGSVVVGNSVAKEAFFGGIGNGSAKDRSDLFIRVLHILSSLLTELGDEVARGPPQYGAAPVSASTDQGNGNGSNGLGVPDNCKSDGTKPNPERLPFTHPVGSQRPASQQQRSHEKVQEPNRQMYRVVVPGFAYGSRGAVSLALASGGGRTPLGLGTSRDAVIEPNWFASGVEPEQTLLQSLIAAARAMLEFLALLLEGGDAAGDALLSRVGLRAATLLVDVARGHFGLSVCGAAAADVRALAALCLGACLPRDLGLPSSSISRTTQAAPAPPDNLKMALGVVSTPSPDDRGVKSPAGDARGYTDTTSHNLSVRPLPAQPQPQPQQPAGSFRSAASDLSAAFNLYLTGPEDEAAAKGGARSRLPAESIQGEGNRSQMVDKREQQPQPAAEARDRDGVPTVARERSDPSSLTRGEVMDIVLSHVGFSAFLQHLDHVAEGIARVRQAMAADIGNTYTQRDEVSNGLADGLVNGAATLGAPLRRSPSQGLLTSGHPAGAAAAAALTSLCDSARVAAVQLFRRPLRFAEDIEVLRKQLVALQEKAAAKKVPEGTDARKARGWDAPFKLPVALYGACGTVGGLTPPPFDGACSALIPTVSAASGDHGTGSAGEADDVATAAAAAAQLESFLSQVQLEMEELWVRNKALATELTQQQQLQLPRRMADGVDSAIIISNGGGQGFPGSAFPGSSAAKSGGVSLPVTFASQATAAVASGASAKDIESRAAAEIRTRRLELESDTLRQQVEILQTRYAEAEMAAEAARQSSSAAESASRKLEADLSDLSTAYNSLETHCLSQEKTIQLLSLAGGGPSLAVAPAFVQNHCEVVADRCVGSAVGVDSANLAFEAEVERRVTAARLEIEEEVLSDLLVCLGQEERKVALLCAELDARGVPSAQLIADIEGPLEEDEGDEGVNA